MGQEDSGSPPSELEIGMEGVAKLIGSAIGFYFGKNQ
jgi:hypothetical protein